MDSLWYPIRYGTRFLIRKGPFSFTEKYASTTPIGHLDDCKVNLLQIYPFLILYYFLCNLNLK